MAPAMTEIGLQSLQPFSMVTHAHSSHLLPTLRLKRTPSIARIARSGRRVPAVGRAVRARWSSAAAPRASCFVRRSSWAAKRPSSRASGAPGDLREGEGELQEKASMPVYPSEDP